MSDYERPRLSIELSEEMHEKRKRYIPWGQEAMLIRHLLSSVLSILEEAGDKAPLALGAILVGDISIFDIIKKGKKR